MKYKQLNFDTAELIARDDVVEYQGYYVSKSGEIYNKHGHQMTPRKNHLGTWVIMLRIGDTRKNIAVNRFLYEAFHQGEDIGYCRIISQLDNDYEIRNGFSDKPVFDVDDLICVPMIKGGNPQTNEYRQTHIRNKQEIIDRRTKLMKHPILNRKAIEILSWVLGDSRWI